MEESTRIPMVTLTRELATIMAAATDAGVTTDFFLIEGEDHGLIVLTAISRALRSRQGDGFAAFRGPGD